MLQKIMRSMPTAFLIFIAWIHSLTVNAQGLGHYEALLNETELRKLAFHKEWLNLLHYRKDNFLKNRYISYVDDHDFFYAQNGKHDPLAELKATLQAFYQTTPQSDRHALCRFPARFHWLKKNLRLPEREFPHIVCIKYRQWLKEIDAHSVSLIFASAYLNSPSSMFGHTLLRLDRKENTAKSDWLSYALNFGAVIQEQDNSLLYAFKGLAGGYSGLFQLMPFFKKIQEYSFMENRDLWEYKLSLTSEETERLLRHLWELQDINFDYYYIGENCSFRLLELLEVARPGSRLTDKFPLTAIPSDIVQAAVEQGFVASVHYRPSQFVELQQQIERIPEPYQPLILSLAEDISTAKSAEFQAIDASAQKQITAAAYQLVRYKTLDQERSAENAKQRFKLLHLLNTYPIDKQATPLKYSAPASPDQGHRSRLAALSAGYFDSKFFTELTYRQNYHDLLDRPDGYFSGAEINFFNLNFRIYEDNRFRLQQLELLNITSLSPRNRFFKPVSWRVATGVKYQNYEFDKLSAYINAGAGVTYALFNDSLSYGFINAHLEHNDNFRDIIEPGVGVALGQLFYSALGTSQLAFESKNFLGGSFIYQLSLDHNFPLDTNQAVRVSLQQNWNTREDFNQAQLSYRYYF
jgi:Domain of unknown function (DUF4105)